MIIAQMTTIQQDARGMKTRKSFGDHLSDLPKSLSSSSSTAAIFGSSSNRQRAESEQLFKRGGHSNSDPCIVSDSTPSRDNNNSISRSGDDNNSSFLLKNNPFDKDSDFGVQGSAVDIDAESNLKTAWDLPVSPSFQFQIEGEVDMHVGSSEYIGSSDLEDTPASENGSFRWTIHLVILSIVFF